MYVCIHVRTYVCMHPCTCVGMYVCIALMGKKSDETGNCSVHESWAFTRISTALHVRQRTVSMHDTHKPLSLSFPENTQK